jgi:hypothetical protein
LDALGKVSEKSGDERDAKEKTRARNTLKSLAT